MNDMSLTTVPAVWPALAALVVVALWIIVRKSLQQQGRATALARTPGVLEGTAMVLLLLGGFIFVVGWLVGCILLWVSPRWRWTDKLLGALVWPGGLVPGLLLGSGLLPFLHICMSSRRISATVTIPTTCGWIPVAEWPWPLIVTAVVLLLGPLAVAARLWHRTLSIPSGH